jgi:hypothetical protein
LPQAQAVGKYDINIGAGMNVVSVQFIRANSAIGQVFQTDLLSEGDYLYFKPLSDSPNTEKATIAGGMWKDDLGNASAIQISPDFGYWIKAANDEILTVCGRVENASSRRTAIKDNGILVIGCVYPTRTFFEDAGLSSSGGAKSGDAVYYKPLADSPNTQKVTFDGTNWSGPEEDRIFTLPFGYWYKRKEGNGDFNFDHLRPWN